MSVLKRLSSLLLVLGLAAGCAKLLPTPRETVGDDARQAITLLASRWEAFSDLRSVAEVEVDRGGGRQRFLGVLLVKRPGSVRFEALSPFGQPFLYFIVHDGRYLSYDATRGEAVSAPATSEMTAEALGLPFEPHDLVSVLSGLATPPDDVRAAQLIRDESGRTVLDLWGPASRKRVWMDPRTGIVDRQELIGGRYSALVTYTRAEGGELRGLQVENSASRTGARLVFRDPVIDGGIDHERFALKLPVGTKLYSVP